MPRRTLAIPISALALAVAVGCASNSPPATGLAPWDQARVTAIGQQLTAAADAWQLAVRRQNPDRLGSGSAEEGIDLTEKAQIVSEQARSLAGHLKAGQGRDQTYNPFRSLKEAGGRRGCRPGAHGARRTHHRRLGQGHRPDGSAQAVLREVAFSTARQWCSADGAIPGSSRMLDCAVHGSTGQRLQARSQFGEPEAADAGGDVRRATASKHQGLQLRDLGGGLDAEQAAAGSEALPQRRRAPAGAPLRTDTSAA